MQIQEKKFTAIFRNVSEILEVSLNITLLFIAYAINRWKHVLFGSSNAN